MLFVNLVCFIKVVEMCILTLEKVDSGPEQHTNVYQIGEHVIGRGPELQVNTF